LEVAANSLPFIRGVTDYWRGTKGFSGSEEGNIRIRMGGLGTPVTRLCAHLIVR
jgi:hypothetical protein